MFSYLTECCLSKTYAFNPHSHVKIWFSKDPNQFLSLVNQLRLIRMRDCLPKKGKIYLIYDSKLINQESYDGLQSFCRTHQIISRDVRCDIFPKCHTKEELQIIDIYEDEISHLQEGGNLGAASDCVRLLKPVYELGTYSDFDVSIDTRSLPEIIYIEAPILVNAYQSSDTTMTFCNDLFSIVDSAQAEPTIRAIQQQLIKNCTRRAERSFIPASHSLPLFSKEKVKSLLEQCLEEGYSCREFRSFIDRLDIWEYMTQKPDSFEQFLSCVKPNLDNFSEFKQRLLLHAVMISTGPSMYMEAMSQYINLWTILLYGKIADSFEDCQLTRLFKGQGVNNSQKNDCSWLEAGRIPLMREEEIMTQQAIKIQRFFKQKHRLFHPASMCSAGSIEEGSNTVGIKIP